MTEPFTAPGGQSLVPAPAQHPYPGAPGMPPPAVPLAAVPPVPAAPKWHRRPLVRTVGRWTAALLICAGAGTGTAMGITAEDRTEVPGLATASDGRWEYPKLELPALPAGSPRPFSMGNTAEIHYADVRDLLLPVPQGGREDEKLNGGWTDADRYLEEYVKDDRAALHQDLDDLAVRHIAARGWTMPDGTSVRVYLLQFSSTAYTDNFLDVSIGQSVPGSPGAQIEGAGEMATDEDFVEPGTGAGHEGRFAVSAETKPYGSTQTRMAYLASGDIAGVVVAERKGGVAAVPFHQTVILQSQLLE